MTDDSFGADESADKNDDALDETAPPHTSSDVSDLPHWLRPLAGIVNGIVPGNQYLQRPHLRRPSRMPGDPKRSAVLILFGDDPEHGPDVLLTVRSATLRAHAGQVSFPGGRIDDLDGVPYGEGVVAAALREAHEEAGVDPAAVRVFGELPELYLTPSDFMVTPVLAWWRTPAPAEVASPDEVSAAYRVPVHELVDPVNRFRLRHPSGFEGPAFLYDEVLVWGFTAGVLDAVLRMAGWEKPWDESRVHVLPVDVREIRRAHGPA